MHVLHKIEIAQAFDELSILEIKKSKLKDELQKKRLEDQICALKKEINQSIGFDLANKIGSSEFYTALFNMNFEIFRYVDELKWAEAASFNKKRFEAKKALQEHFAGQILGEIKI